METAQIETASLATYTLTEIVEIMVEVAAQLAANLFAVAWWAGLEIIAGIFAVLSANYIILDAYALSRGDPSIYIEAGASLWEGFWPAVYGEEGTYSGYVSNFNDGTYWPCATMAGTWASMQQHGSVWNPAVMPPWGV
jgi:hypothetical protein